MYQESKKRYIIETLYVLQTDPKEAVKSIYMIQNSVCAILVAYVLEADNKSVKSIYKSQLEKLTQKKGKLVHTH